MRWLALIAFASAAVLATVAAAQTSDLAGLEGLWVAHARYGPDVRGPLARRGAAAHDRMTYYLPVTRRADRRKSTYLRNPGRNQGIFPSVTRIEQDGEKVRLARRRQWMRPWPGVMSV